MDVRRLLLFCLLLVVSTFAAKAQLIGFRLAANSGMHISELGNSDVPHPDALLLSPPTSSEKFTPQLSAGFEGEVLFQVTEKTYFGVELDYSHLKGFNDDPPVFNYFLTPYFQYYQDEFYITPLEYNTRLFNLAVNYKYFFMPDKTFTPFVKLTGVVAFVRTDLMYRELPDPDLEWNILYSRGTKNSEQDSWPAFHIGGGIGFDYAISDKLLVEVDGTFTVLNSGIIDGVPNFTYEQEEGVDLLRYNRRLSLTAQVSAGFVYLLEIGGGRRGSGGRVDPSLPFYRNKN
ncbi:outer membrane beta-barrel protein [uncultured Draconibacterium sp.]|uniref:outer membrane beta-barrel protein n=1 Tax=uncultured Draconibacterium sp. TaxID=1573823 RepID=UPI0029C70EBC|nr:outer membrane beta-barrel protein [uncultured Draconibacterium sp.]